MSVLPIDRQLAFSVNAAASACGVRPYHIRRAIAEYVLIPRAWGRRSIILRSELVAYLEQLPRTKTPKRKEPQS